MVDLAGIEPVSKLDPIQPSTCLSNYLYLITFLSISKQEDNEIVYFVSLMFTIII